MSPEPHLTTFRDRLTALLVAARQSGRLAPGDYESLLVDPDFDADNFERFRAAAQEHGIALPEDDPEPPASPAHAPGGRERDLLDRYLDEIGRIALLRHEDLIVLARRAAAGSADARRRIILANLRLVVHLARGYRNRGLPMLDLIEEGNLGLIHAVDLFDAERAVRFSTYASPWIRQFMLRGIAEQARAVRIPVQMFQQAQRYLRLEHVLRANLGREPTATEVAAALGISTPRAERLAALVRGLHSLDQSPGIEAFEQLSAEDFGQEASTVEHLVELQLEHERVDRMLRSLGQREEQVLRIRYGFHDGIARTLAETGLHFGITRERVRQIEARALEKLRRALALAAGNTVPGDASA